MPCALACGFGSNFHFTFAVFGWRRSNAYTVLGYGVTTYMVSPMTSGAASWPLSIPVGKLNASFSEPTLLALICASGLKRVPCGSWPTTGHSPEAADAAVAGGDGVAASTAPQPVNASARRPYAARVRCDRDVRFTLSSPGIESQAPEQSACPIEVHRVSLRPAL